MSLGTMATKLYTTRVAIELNPTDGTPDVVVSVDDNILHSGPLSGPTTFIGSYQLPVGNHSLKVIHRNKASDDPTTAVTIENITFNDISRSKFIWEGVYHPEYPEPWASQMRANGYNLDTTLTSIDHLGWNGTWELTFSIPIFTWIHNIEDLGWIYT